VRAGVEYATPGIILQHLLNSIRNAIDLPYQTHAIPREVLKFTYWQRGTKLPRSNPCCSKSAIHSLSFWSVFRPGTALRCWAFTSNSRDR
jgi:hypothetical protein